MFDRIKRLLYDDSHINHDELWLLLARSLTENGWNEPGMEDYDNYDRTISTANERGDVILLGRAECGRSRRQKGGQMTWNDPDDEQKNRQGGK